MATLIFKSFEDFEKRENKADNGVCEMFAKNHRFWQETNRTNIGCWNCYQCTNCTECIKCRNCWHCDNCEWCEFCNFGERLQKCSHVEFSAHCDYLKEKCRAKFNEQN